MALRYPLGVSAVFFGILNFFPASWANEQLEGGKAALHKMTGCYLVDYSYSETKSLNPKYALDSRVYDVNKDKSVKEWIYAEDISPKRIRLQHILFMTDLTGNSDPEKMLKHQTEDWEFEAPFRYEFTSPGNWVVQDQNGIHDQWTRKITNLDDGLRYQCTSSWNFKAEYSNWTCENYAPIPGRETRDMGRKDYNTLQRITELVLYGNSWLERQENTKINFQDETKTPLANEVGKNWYVRLPDSECQIAQDFVQPRQAFWNLLRETWDEILIGDRPFIEKISPKLPPRFLQVREIEDAYLNQNLLDPAIRKAAKKELFEAIGAYRLNSKL